MEGQHEHCRPDPDTCPECGTYGATRTDEETTYTVHPEMALTVTYKFPAYTCTCGFSWTGYEKEDAEMLARLKVVQEKLGELWKENKSLRAFKANVDEALNSGDGSYRP